MFKFLLAIFCAFFPHHSACVVPSVSTVVPKTAQVTPMPQIPKPPPVTYKTIYTSPLLSASTHTFSLSIQNPKPSVGYQVQLRLSPQVDALAVTQSTISSLRNLVAKSTPDTVSLAALIDNPLDPWKLTKTTQIGRLTFSLTSPTKITFDLGSNSKINEYDKTSPEIKNLLENNTARVTIIEVK